MEQTNKAINAHHLNIEPRCGGTTAIQCTTRVVFARDTVERARAPVDEPVCLDEDSELFQMVTAFRRRLLG